LVSLAILTANLAADEQKPALRPPAVPLVAHDPYFSVWSCADRLTDDTTRHWTGTKQALTSMIRIDGKAYRIMGDEPKAAPALPQKKLQVLPTRTIYDFEGASVHVKLTFMTPALPEDLDLLSLPVTYLTWDVWVLDGKEHEILIFFSASAELVVNEPSQKVVWARQQKHYPVIDGDLHVLKIGSQEQPVLEKKGDNLRIDWGYAYVATLQDRSTAMIGSTKSCTQSFAATGKLPAQEDARPLAVRDGLPVAAVVWDYGKVKNPVSDPIPSHALIAYDDEYSITYFGRKLRPFWRRDDANIADLLHHAEGEYGDLNSRCE